MPELKGVSLATMIVERRRCAACSRRGVTDLSSVLTPTSVSTVSTSSTTGGLMRGVAAMVTIGVNDDVIARPSVLRCAQLP